MKPSQKPYAANRLSQWTGGDSDMMPSVSRKKSNNKVPPQKRMGAKIRELRLRGYK